MNDSNNLLSGKNVLITGAGRNIGKSIAIEMAKQGANIFFTDIDKELCSQLEQELNEYKVKSKSYNSDISKIEDIDLLVNTLIQNGIIIDILINNVGISPEKNRLKDVNLDEWHKVFDVNVFNPIFLTNCISRMMIKNKVKGSIIFNTSIHQWTIRRIASYSSSKSALGMVIKEMALDLAPYGIRVNGIAPGYVEEDKKGRTIKHKYTPLHNSSINPCYVGRAAVYLSSDYFSKFTTGTVIKIDAGLSLYNHLVEQIPLK